MTYFKKDRKTSKYGPKSPDLSRSGTGTSSKKNWVKTEVKKNKSHGVMILGTSRIRGTDGLAKASERIDSANVSDEFEKT